MATTAARRQQRGASPAERVRIRAIVDTFTRFILVADGLPNSNGDDPGDLPDDLLSRLNGVGGATAVL